MAFFGNVCNLCYVCCFACYLLLLLMLMLLLPLLLLLLFPAMASCCMSFLYLVHGVLGRLPNRLANTVHFNVVLGGVGRAEGYGAAAGLRQNTILRKTSDRSGRSGDHRLSWRCRSPRAAGQRLRAGRRPGRHTKRSRDPRLSRRCRSPRAAGQRLRGPPIRPPLRALRGPPCEPALQVASGRGPPPPGTPAQATAQGAPETPA